MEAILPILVVVCFVVWIVAEASWSRLARIILGLICMVVITVTVSFFASIGPSIDRIWHRASLQQLAQSIAEGKTDEARHALEVFSDTYDSTRSTREASFAMYRSLTRD